MKIKIAVAIDAAGNWSANGWGGPGQSVKDLDKMSSAIDNVGEHETHYWVEAEIPSSQPIKILQSSAHSADFLKPALPGDNKDARFEREPRYIVFKISDLERYVGGMQLRLWARECELFANLIKQGRIDEGRMPFNPMVLEADWPEFDAAWASIEKRMSKAAGPLKGFADLGRNELHRIREWFDSCQDVNSSYLESKDYDLAKRIYEACGMRVPNFILEKCNTPRDSAQSGPSASRPLESEAEGGLS